MLLARAADQREAEARAQQRVRMTEALAARREAEASAEAAGQALATAVAARAAAAEGPSAGEHRGPPVYAYCTVRSVEHTSELQSLMRNSYAVFCLKKKKKKSIKQHQLQT